MTSNMKRSSKDTNVYINSNTFVNPKTGEKIQKCDINLGKIDYHLKGNGRRNEVELCLELKTTKDGKHSFSVVGFIWNNLHSTSIAGGQCRESIYFNLWQLSENAKEIGKKIYRLWRDWHLNDVHIGTPEQDECLKKNGVWGNSWNYDKACKCLSSNGLYEVEVDGKPCRYGESWLYRELPRNVLSALEKLFSINGGFFEKPAGDEVLEALAEL